mgnify:CR=1 FL=1
MTANNLRASLVGRAFRLEWSTIGWMLIEFGVALYAGIMAHSLALIAFSLDSLIEIGHAGLLIWRLNTELRLGADFPEAIERRASRIGAWILAGLALYIAIGALWEFWHHQSAEFSTLGLGVTLVAIPLMYFLSRVKYGLADRLGSRALRGDAAESASCLYLSITIVIALIAQSFLGFWWIDAAASLIIAFFVAREAREGFEDEECGGD